MISKYLKSKNIINEIKSTVDEKTLTDDIKSGFYHLKTHNLTSTYYFYRNLFNNYEIEKIKALCKKLPQNMGSIGNNNINLNYRESRVSWVPVNNQTHWIYQKLTDCILDVNNSFFEYDLTKIEKLQFTAYYGNEKGFYAPHIDSNFDTIPENRKLTFVLQLSNPDDYQGGELRLHTSKEPIMIKKEKGLISFFPSHTLHECTPVISGERYTLVGWIYGPKFK